MNRIVLRAMIDRSALSKSHKRVAQFLLRIDTDTVFVGVARTAKKLGIAVSTARLAFRELEAAGVLKLVAIESHGTMPRVYSFHPKAFKRLAADPAEIGGVSASRRNRRGQTPPKSARITNGEKKTPPKERGNVGESLATWSTKGQAIQ